MSAQLTDFFFVGYPKSGSTTFYNLLKAHPEFYATDLKEPKFFSTDIYREAKERLGNNYYEIISSKDEYLLMYKDANGRICGDFNPFNIFSKEAPRNIHDLNPNAKIIISIREPVSFLRSFHFQSLFRLVEDEPDFLKALELESARKAGKNIPELCQIPSYLYYSELVKYRDHIKNFTDIFGFQNVKVILFEDIVRNEQAVYQKILQFLNADDTNFKPPPPDRNPSHALRFVWLRKMLFNPPVRKWLYDHVPLKILPIGAKISQKIFKKEQEKPFVSPENIQRLKERFRSNVVDLNEFLNNNGLLDGDLCNAWNY